MQVIIRSQIYTHMLVSWLKHTFAALPGEESMAVTGELHLCVNKLVYAPQPGRGCALHPSPPVCVSVAGCCCCCCVSLSKERFWKMAHGGRKRARAALCRSACPNMLEVWQRMQIL